MTIERRHLILKKTSYDKKGTRVGVLLIFDPRDDPDPDDVEGQGNILYFWEAYGVRGSRAAKDDKFECWGDAQVEVADHFGVPASMIIAREA